MPQFVEPAAVRQKRILCCGTTGLQSSFFLQADRLLNSSPTLQHVKWFYFLFFLDPSVVKLMFKKIKLLTFNLFPH